MSNEHKAKKVGLTVSWWIAFILIGVLVGGATAGSIYSAVTILGPMIGSWLPASILPFITHSAVIPILAGIISHVGFLASAYMWGNLYFQSMVGLINRFFMSPNERFEKDLEYALRQELFTDIGCMIDNEDKDLSQSVDHRKQHLTIFLLNKLAQEIQKHYESSTLNKEKIAENTIPHSIECIIHKLRAVKSVQKASIQNATTAENKYAFYFSFEKEMNHSQQYDIENIKPSAVSDYNKLSSNLEQFKLIFPLQYFKFILKKEDVSFVNTDSNLDNASVKSPFPQTSKKPSYRSFAASVFFALAVGGFNFTANLTAGALLLNISQLTSWQAVQSTVLHHFAQLGLFAQGLGVLGGVVTVLTLIPFLVTFIRNDLQKKQSREIVKSYPNYGDGYDNQRIVFINATQNKKSKSFTQKLFYNFYELTLGINGFLVNSFGIGFGFMAILSTALGIISPNLALSFPVVSVIASIACVSGVLAALTMTRTNTLASVNSLFKDHIEMPQRPHSKQSTKIKAKWYAKLPRYATTMANIIVLCTFTLSSSSYWSVLFGVPQMGRIIIAILLAPCVLYLTNKIFKDQDVPMQKSMNNFISSAELMSAKLFKPFKTKSSSCGSNPKINPVRQKI